MIEGLLTKPTQYYTISNSNQMEEAVVRKGIELMESVGATANITVTAPLVTQIKQIGLLKIFLESSMSTIVFFLAILSIQLIYSLMISDVDEKTYQYGMLRALGLYRRKLITLISL
jgi:ABC-type antimicrobial peptide transport system permease subunit